MDVITGSGYTVNPKMLGFQMCVYIGITLERGSMYKEVVSELEKIPEIVESQYTLGHYTILIKLYARNDEHLMQLLNGRIQEIPGVAATETLTSLDQRIKRSIPIE
jgi:Lrp/AsnC family transcriptional regulator for asnA, asnC and gidA